MISKYVLEKLETGLRRERRRWVVIYLTGILLALAGSFLDAGGQSAYWLGLIVFVAGIFLFIFSSFQLFRRHYLVEIAHSPVENLDERQRQVRLQASELAYTFVVGSVSLLFIALFSLSQLSWRPDLTSVDWLFIAFMLATFVVSFRLILVAWLEPDPLPDETDSEHPRRVTG